MRIIYIHEYRRCRTAGAAGSPVAPRCGTIRPVKSWTLNYSRRKLRANVRKLNCKHWSHENEIRAYSAHWHPYPCVMCFNLQAFRQRQCSSAIVQAACEVWHQHAKWNRMRCSVKKQCKNTRTTDCLARHKCVINQGIFWQCLGFIISWHEYCQGDVEFLEEILLFRKHEARHGAHQDVHGKHHDLHSLRSRRAFASIMCIYQ